MKMNLSLTVISAFMIAAFSCHSAFADKTDSSSSVAVDSNKVIELKDGSKVREMINNQQRSLYQIALLSNISIAELREMNAGRFNNKDTVEVGDRLVLPVNSPILPAIKKADSNTKDKHSNLPQLSSDDNYNPKNDKDAVATQVASTLQTLSSQDWKQISSSDNGGVSGHLKDKGKDYAEGYVRNGVKSQVVDPLRSAAQDLLGRFGTAQLQFDVGDKGEFNNLNMKLFSPWYDSDSTLIFSQMSFQEYEHNRRIGNFGIGQRWDVADKKWLLGYNIFFDHDFQRSHNRLGIGTEAWTDFMKFAVNYYHPLSDWKDSRDFDDYLERAAKGFDVRFQGYLPQYPQFGGSLMYEQYFGDKVALFGKDNLQKNPKAVTVGLDYTPVPLFTIKAEHKQGQNSKHDTKAELTMNFRIGTPLKDQLDPDMVQVARSLKGSRYDLVDRNNYIVLEYKEKKMSVDLGLEALQFIEGETYGVSINVHNAKVVSKLSWSGDMAEIDAGGGFFCSAVGLCTSSTWQAPTTETNNWKIVAPAYVDQNGLRRPVATNGKYTLFVTVTNSHGKSATSNPVTFEVLPNLTVRKLAVYAVDQSGSKTVLANNNADGLSAVTLMASLVKSKNIDGVISSVNDVIGFSDEAAMSQIPDTFEAIQKNWTATSNGRKITLVDGTSGNVRACPTSEPCVIVKSFEKVKMGQHVSSNSATASGTTVIGDTYTLDVASNINGLVDFNMTLDQYGTSINKASVNFTGGGVGTIEVWNANSGVLVASAKGSSLLEFDTNLPNQLRQWKVDSEYYVKAYDAGGVEIQNPFVIWSLVNSNSSACPGVVATTLPSALQKPQGPWFNVSMGRDAHYIIRSARTLSYATSGTSIPASSDVPAGLNVDLSSVTASPTACAGDQGFKLQVAVY